LEEFVTLSGYKISVGRNNFYSLFHCAKIATTILKYTNKILY
jgi:hypothetical protein